jgi:hypothetical protein
LATFSDIGKVASVLLAGSPRLPWIVKSDTAATYRWKTPNITSVVPGAKVTEVDDRTEEAENRFAAHIAEVKESLMAGRNQNVMRLVLIELITAGHRIKASPLCATVDYSERNSPL